MNRIVFNIIRNVLIVCFFFASIFTCAGATPQQSTAGTDADADQNIGQICQANVDCLNYYQNTRFLYTLFLVGNPGVAVKGKKKLQRQDILQHAESYIRDHHHSRFAPLYWRYLSCVSKALAGEAELKTTIFSSENIIETFYAVMDDTEDTNVNNSVNRTCEMLEAYYHKLTSASDDARVNRDILEKKEKKTKETADEAWHGVLLDQAKGAAPNEPAEAVVARWRAKYCLFAEACPTSQNSPFSK